MEQDKQLIQQMIDQLESKIEKKVKEIDILSKKVELLNNLMNEVDEEV